MGVDGGSTIGVGNVYTVAITTGWYTDTAHIASCCGMYIQPFTSVGLDVEPGMEMTGPKFTHAARKVIDTVGLNREFKIALFDAIVLGI